MYLHNRILGVSSAYKRNKHEITAHIFTSQQEDSLLQKIHTTYYDVNINTSILTSSLYHTFRIV
jgi:hypothetical protein